MTIRRPALTVAVLLAFCTAAATVAVAQDKPKAKGEPVKVDLSSPKKAAMTFAHGIERNDQKAVRAASAGPEADYPMFETLSTVAMAAADVKAAAVEKFGAEEAKKVTQGQDSIAAKVEGTTEKIEGDTATLSDGAGEPLRLKKVGNDWKVDLASMPNRDQMAQAVPMMKGIAKGMTEIAGDIRGGKLKTAEEAQQAIGAKMIAALGAAGGDAGAGGPAPAKGGAAKEPKGAK